MYIGKRDRYRMKAGRESDNRFPAHAYIKYILPGHIVPDSLSSRLFCMTERPAAEGIFLSVYPVRLLRCFLLPAQLFDAEADQFQCGGGAAWIAVFKAEVINLLQ